jgi:hypothetical protein
MSSRHFSGEWISEYSYQSSDMTKPASSSHIVVLQEAETGIEGESVPQKDGSSLSFALRHDQANGVLTGTWQESTSPSGHYRGAIFHGALQLLLNEAYDQAEGQWVGFNSSRTQIKTGEWRLKKSQDS